MDWNVALFWPELRIDSHGWIPCASNVEIVFFSMIRDFQSCHFRSVHEDIKGTTVFDGSTSNLSEAHGVKQGCVLVPTLFAIFFTILSKHSLGSATEGIYLRYRSDGKLLTRSRLRAKSICNICAISSCPWRSSHHTLSWRPPTAHELLQ